MALTPGTRLGIYEVIAQIGEGGMGQVYRGTDTTLGRQVAITILPHAFAADAERVARFEREAKTLASLNHPNIAAIYGFEKSGGTHALVMELVEGEDLSQRIARGAIPVDEALAIAKQIAEALEAAHEQGIIHRDLKPANIKVRSDGTVKVLDFGLAKAMEPVGAAAPSVSQAPTITAPAMMTGVGMILGTAAYMSPEQARGRTVDRRADIWAFGAVLFEMLTGQRAFGGDDVSEVLSRVLQREPDWTALPSGLSPTLVVYLTRCLHKDLKQRIGDIHDVRLALEGAFDTHAAEDGRHRGWQRAPALGAATFLIGAALAGSAAWMSTRADTGPANPVTRFVLEAGSGLQLAGGGSHVVALSPDGTRIAFTANSRLYVRALAELEATPMRGTERARGTLDVREPFFSPDGEWIGFFQGGQLKKAPVGGGAPLVICDAARPYEVTWGTDGTIVFGGSRDGRQGVWRVPSGGGRPERLIAVGEGQTAHGPQVIPGTNAVLCTLAEGNDWEHAQIVVQPIGSDDRQVLVRGGTDARLLPSGHLVWSAGTSLLAAPFDVNRLTLTASAVPVIEGVQQIQGGQTGAAQFAWSPAGTLVYQPELVVRRTLVWVSRDGREQALSAPDQAYMYPRLSPDGTRAAVVIQDRDFDLWVLEFARDTLTRITSTPEPEVTETWSADGLQLFFGTAQGGAPRIYRRASNSTGASERLTDGPAEEPHWPDAVLPGGQGLLFSARTAATEWDLRLISLDDSLTARTLLHEPFIERNAAISPDGRWMAYQSTESGQPEIYVRPFPDVDSAKWRVSTAGGVAPVWDRRGPELYFRSLDGGVMATPAVMNSAVPQFGRPSQLFPWPVQGQNTAGRLYDVAADGRFLMIKPSSDSADASRMIVVQNWFEELKRLVPTK